MGNDKIQVTDEVRESIWSALFSVEPFNCNFRRMADLRIKLREMNLGIGSDFFETDQSTADFLRNIFSTKELKIITDYKDKKNKEYTVYIVYAANSSGNKSVNRPKGDNTHDDDDKKSADNSSNGGNKKKYFSLYIGKKVLQHIADLAEKEVWHFKNENDNDTSILGEYINQVLNRLKYECETLKRDRKIVIVKDGEHKRCAINTGLVSRKTHKNIYMLFDENHGKVGNNGETSEWIFDCIEKRDDNKKLVRKNIIDDESDSFFSQFKGRVPLPPDFTAGIEDSVLKTALNKETPLQLNHRHIFIDHCERLPMGFLKRCFSGYFALNREPVTKDDWDDFKKYVIQNRYQYEEAEAILTYRIEQARTKAHGDDQQYAKIAYPDAHTVGLYLPLYLEDHKDIKDFEVGAIIVYDGNNGIYSVKTIYPPDMAYKKIRLMGSHKRPFLDLSMIPKWIDPYHSKADNIEDGNGVSPINPKVDILQIEINKLTEENKRLKDKLSVIESEYAEVKKQNKILHPSAGDNQTVAYMLYKDEDDEFSVYPLSKGRPSFFASGPAFDTVFSGRDDVNLLPIITRTEIAFEIRPDANGAGKFRIIDYCGTLMYNYSPLNKGKVCNISHGDNISQAGDTPFTVLFAYPKDILNNI